MSGVERIISLGLAALLLTPPVTAGAGDTAFITTTDFISGSSSVLHMDGSHTETNNVASVHSDAVVRYFDGLLYVVNRFGADNIQVLDPGNNYSTVIQYTVGAGSDPHDMLVLSPTKAYVTRYNLTSILIVHPLTGASLGTIDLSAYADADGIPEMDYMIRVGDYAFVSIQRLDRNNFFSPTAESYLAVIDIATDTVVDVDTGTSAVDPIVLTGTNPFSEIQLDPWGGRLLVACVGFFGLQDGGIDEIDPYALTANGFIFTEATAGGDIQDVELVSPDKGYVIIADPSFNTNLISFDVSSGALLKIMYAPGGFVLQDVEKSPFGNVALLSDRTAVNPGIRCYDTTTDTEITTNPVDVGLPPFDIVFDQPVQTGVDNKPPPVAYLGDGFPNPFRGDAAAIPFSLDRGGFVRLGVYDVAGRRVRLLREDYLAAGDYTARWDGRDDSSRAVPSGVYFVRLETGRQREVNKLVVVK